MRVFLSGIHSDPDPSAGVGLARSIRLAYPDATLMGIDYSPTSSGIHSGVFDQIMIQRPWNELDLSDYAARIAHFLDDPHTYWLSSLDVESRWLAEAVGDHPRLLVPCSSAIAYSRKPVVRAARSLEMKTPPSMAASAGNWELHRFGRTHDWDLWVKGMHHGARRSRSWKDMREAIWQMCATWDLPNVFVQAHVAGTEQSLTFAAMEGRLLGCVLVQKRLQTAAGKTWAAEVSEPEPDVRESVAAFVHETRWTGGGEAEFVCTAGGDRMLIDVNPRFPAYIHGITLCGLNLPALLLADAAGLPMQGKGTVSGQFARIVHEVPVAPGHGIPLPTESEETEQRSGKHPSCQPQLVRKLRRAEDVLPNEGGFTPPKGWRWVVQEVEGGLRTPVRLRIPGVAESCVRRIAEAVRPFSEPTIQPAISVKTLPDCGIANAAREASWWAEVISVPEARWAVRAGFTPNHMVFNGPATSSLALAPDLCIGVVFHDSVESLHTNTPNEQQIDGLRVRLPWHPSRFGVPVDDPVSFCEIATALGRRIAVGTGRDYALQFHLASDVVGIKRWFAAFEAFVAWSVQIADLLGRGPRILDCGGGWHPDDLESFLISAIPEMWRAVRSRLSSVELLLLEPGKAVSAPAFALVTTVIEVRKGGPHSGREAVIDASVADLPMASVTPHRILHWSRDNRRSSWLGTGSDRLLGPICMESDIIDGSVSLPDEIKEGDKVIVFDAGAYDVSMAWDFGQGVFRDGS